MSIPQRQEFEDALDNVEVSYGRPIGSHDILFVDYRYEYRQRLANVADLPTLYQIK
jgi:hypothetical protein